MDLLQENKNNNNKTPAQKMVLTLLIISIILCIIIAIIMAVISIQGEKAPYSIKINGKDVDLNQIQLISNAEGERYISLKTISNLLGYNYYNGEFNLVEEDKNKGYIDNKINIIQFFYDSNEIYKTSEGSHTDYEYYKLSNKIIKSEETLYIDLDDLDIALNLIVNFSSTKNQTVIETPEYWISKNSSNYNSKNISISNTSENKKALSYGYIIVSKDGKYGVINLLGEEIIGIKYNSIKFCEFTNDFIVSNTDNKIGIISSKGLAKISFQYDSLEIINYNPLLYKVEKIKQYGVMREDGSIVNDIIYKSIGYPENKEKGINKTLIIPNLNDNIPESIVVYSNNKYGLINLENGEEIVSCILDGLYSVTKDNKTYYIAEAQNTRMFLETFMDKASTMY